MEHVFVLLVLLSFLALIYCEEKKVVCEYNSWSHYRPGDEAYPVEKIDPFLCTHLIYISAGINEDATIKLSNPWLELPNNSGEGNFNEFNKLQITNPDLKTLINVGGWDQGSAKFSIIANDPILRIKFAKEVKNFTLKYGFDGANIMWLYPARRDSVNPSTDKQDFSLLLMELRTEFDTDQLLLSISVGSTKYEADISYDIPKIIRYVNFINLMSYGFHGNWYNNTGHGANLINVKNAINFWLQEGAPANKLNLGIRLHGMTYNLTNSSDNSVGSASYGAGFYENKKVSFIEFNKICKMLNLEIWDINASVPYLSNNNLWITYENMKSITAKMQFFRLKDLGGTYISSIDYDDYNNICKLGNYPLLNHINKCLNRKINNKSNHSPIFDMENNLIDFDDKINCQSSGYIRDLADCNKFYYCMKKKNGLFKVYKFNCPTGLIFDDHLLVCNYLYIFGN